MQERREFLRDGRISMRAGASIPEDPARISAASPIFFGSCASIPCQPLLPTLVPQSSPADAGRPGRGAGRGGAYPGGAASRPKVFRYADLDTPPVQSGARGLQNPSTAGHGRGDTSLRRDGSRGSQVPMRQRRRGDRMPVRSSGRAARSPWIPPGPIWRPHLAPCAGWVARPDHRRVRRWRSFCPAARGRKGAQRLGGLRPVARSTLAGRVMTAVFPRRVEASPDR